MQMPSSSWLRFERQWNIHPLENSLWPSQSEISGNLIDLQPGGSKGHFESPIKLSASVRVCFKKYPSLYLKDSGALSIHIHF